MPVEKFLLFLYNSVYFFMKSQQLLGVNHLLTATSSAALAETTDTLAFVSTSSESVLEVVPIILLLLLKLFLVTQNRILLLC